MDNQSITHTRWNCTYHIVFIPKFRRKIMYGETKRDLVEIVEVPNHPYFVACQFHPEFNSRPNRAHPLFQGLIDPAHKKKYN